MSDKAARQGEGSSGEHIVQLQEACYRFASAWKEGTPPSLREHLSEAWVAAQPGLRRDLLMELITIDLQYRWRSSQPAAGGAERSGEAAALLPRRPLLEDYLRQYPELGTVAQLPDQLIAHEYRVRRGAGDCPSHGEYSSRFGRDRHGLWELLDAVDRELRVGELTDGLQPTGLPSKERFEIERRIGEGGMGVVYRAFDRHREQVVALKALRKLDPGPMYRLKREFRTLADLVHPNLASLYDLFAAEDEWFFSMEYVDGVDFLTYVRVGVKGPPGDGGRRALCDATTDDAGADTSSPDVAASRFPDRAGRDGACGDSVSSSAAAEPSQQFSAEQAARLRKGLRQLADGVLALHRAGWLHRDIKPSNVMVTREERVVLLDFGLATELGPAEIAETTSRNIVGTIPYMSPEQATGGELSPASDWYSVGVMLHEALTDRPLFRGSLWQVLREKRESPPPPPGELAVGVPEDLDQLCVQLLRLDPKARPAGDEIEALLSSGEDSPLRPVVFSAPARQTPFVGRAAQLEQLRGALQRVRAGVANVVYVHGESGSGKTMLIQHFLKELRRDSDVVVLAGRCYQNETVPYKALDSVVDSLSHQLAGLTPLEADALMPHNAGALGRVFPVMRRIEAVASSCLRAGDSPDRQELRQRAFDGLRELLVRLGDRKTLVVHIDDIQWIDVDSVALATELLRPPDPPVLLLLACYRTADLPANRALQSLLDAHVEHGSGIELRRMAVGALGDAEARTLVLRILGEGAPGAAELSVAIANEAGGNPYFVAVLAHSRRAVGAPLGDPRTAEKVSLDNLLWEGIWRLPSHARRLLELVAVAGQPLPVAHVFRAGEMSGDGAAAVAALRHARLARTTATELGEAIETYHDRVRETILPRLTQEQTVQIHRCLAHSLAEANWSDFAAVAAHFVGAEETAQAGRWYRAAADQAASALAFDRAVTLYGVAIQFHHGSPLEKRALQRQSADALANAGYSVESAEAYVRLAEGAGRAEMLDLYRRATLQFLASGCLEEGLNALRTLLRTVGMSLPRSPRRALAQLLWTRAKLWLRGLDFQPRDAGVIAEEALHLTDICWSAGIGLSFVDPLSAAAFEAEGLLRSLRCGEPGRVARFLALEAGHAASWGQRGQQRAGRMLQQSETVAQGSGDPHALGLVRLVEGIAACLRGRWIDAVRLCDEAAAIFRDRCTGVAWESDTSQAWAVSALTWQGEVAEIARRLPRLQAESQKRGKLYALRGLYARNLVKLAGDDPDTAERYVQLFRDQWPRGPFYLQHLTELREQLQVDLYRGNGEQAWARIQRHWWKLRASFLLRVALVRGGMYEIRARCALAAAARASRPERLRRLALNDARRLEKERQPWMQPMAQLIRANAAAQRGQSAPAVAWLEQAVSGFQQADMGLWAAAAQRRLGQLLGGVQGRRLSSESAGWMSAQGVVDAERMAALITPGFPG